MIVLLKLLIVVAVVGLLRSSEKFRRISQEFDEAALVSLQRLVRASEESGYPPETVPLLICPQHDHLYRDDDCSGFFNH